MITTKNPPYTTTGELGDTLGVQSWRIARWRLIPKSMVPAVVDALRARG